jgi:serine/threonine protein kinase
MNAPFTRFDKLLRATFRGSTKTAAPTGAALASRHREGLASRRIGAYQLTRLLGGGGMGEVYLAEHVLLKRACAVKLIRADRTQDPQAKCAQDHPWTSTQANRSWRDASDYTLEGSRVETNEFAETLVEPGVAA